jgi:glutamate carboxypeptidase
VQDIAGRPLPHASSTLTFDDSYPPMAPSEGNRALLEHYDRASRDLGTGPVTAVDPRQAGAADIAFAAPHVRMAIDAIGLKGSADHTVNESANLRLLPVQTKRAAVLLYRLARGAR